eukprot:1149975-Pelagomonas_calceolata.AAC.4
MNEVHRKEKSLGLGRRLRNEDAQTDAPRENTICLADKEVCNSKKSIQSRRGGGGDRHKPPILNCIAVQYHFWDLPLSGHLALQMAGFIAHRSNLHLGGSLLGDLADVVQVAIARVQGDLVPGGHSLGCKGRGQQCRVTLGTHFPFTAKAYCAGQTAVHCAAL